MNLSENWREKLHVLITGGAGFIGSNFVRMYSRNLFKDISKVTVLDKLTYAGNLGNLNGISESESFKFVQGDICDSSLIDKLLGEVDAVINFAAESHVDRSISNSDEFINTNVVGVHRILESCRKNQRKIRFVQVSTDEVYGSIQKGSWDEDCPLQPNSPYSASKGSADLLVRSYYKTYEMDVVITRSSNNFGPFQFPEKFIPLAITNLLSGKKIPIYGEGKNIRDWLYVEDHCMGIYLALRNGASGEIYNIGGGVELKNIDLAQSIVRLLGNQVSSIEFVPDRKGHDFRYSISCEKANRELGYSPSYDFDDAMRSTIEWYKKNLSWWNPLI